MKKILFGLTTLFTACSSMAAAGGFSAIASPPRFELTGKPGQVIQEVLEVTNANPEESTFSVRTMDWSLRADTTVDLTDDLVKESCRPWVALERPSLKLRAGGKFRYRFQVKIPENAPVGECRFAVVLESGTFQAKDQPLPVAARMAVIVYLTIGDAKPSLSLLKTESIVMNDVRYPAITMKNLGNAHDRLAGFVKATDATGQQFDLSPATFPILSGETRQLFLQPDNEVEKWKKAVFPIKLTGTLEWSRGKIPLDTIIK